MAKKLFVAISLDKQQRHEIAQLQRHLGKELRLVPICNLHMTIAFFGQVSSKIEQQLEQGISALNKRKFSITLNKLNHWRKPRILCITGDTNDNALLQLVKECQLLAASLGLQQSYATFKAHVTVARKAQHLPGIDINFIPLIIQANAIHLYQSKSTDNGVEYHILRSWLLE